MEYLSTISSDKSSSVTLIIASLKRSSQVLHVGVCFNAFFTTVHFLSACLTMTDT